MPSQQFLDAVRYAVALMRKQLVTAGDAHKPVIVAHIAALEAAHELVAAADTLVAEDRQRRAAIRRAQRNGQEPCRVCGQLPA
jgi:hypothetical protein